MSEVIRLNNVNTFPSTKLYSINKLITENSLTRLINRLIDNDGYVITDGVRNLTGVNVDFGKDLPLSNWTANNLPFEFVIRGYYFSINDIANDLLSKIQWGGDIEESLMARIYIDKTVPGYPELFGQNGINPCDESITDFESGVTTIKNSDLAEATSDPELYEIGDDNIKHTISTVVSINPSNGAISAEFIAGKGDADVAGIKYNINSEYGGIEFYTTPAVKDSDAASPLYTVPSSLGDSVEAYEFEIIRHFKPEGESVIDTYIPMSSLYKFNSYSIGSIDGGELVYNNVN